MVRGALWLLQVVGIGNIFTKEEVRAAFPGISQVDRRLRDLRDYGWVILTNSDDATLSAEEQRFVQPGAAVWDPNARRAAAPVKAISAKEAHAVMSRDDFMCTKCGIMGGESYPGDSNQTAVLSVTRRETVLPDGRTEIQAVTECKRCRAGSPDGEQARADEVLSGLRLLDASDQRRLRNWIRRGKRGTTDLDRVWSAYRRLPVAARDEFAQLLDTPID